MNFRDIINDHNKIINDLINQEDELLTVIYKITSCVQSGGKILLMGNGGSAADCQHIAAEFVGRFKKSRDSIPAISLTTDSSVITAISNDFGYNEVFKRQLEGLLNKEDVVWAISTSGQSENIINALTYAKSIGVEIISFLGTQHSEQSCLSDYFINVESCNTARVQEAHIFLAHIICEGVESLLYG